MPKTMEAAVYRGDQCVEVERVPVPNLGPGEILLRVHACGVCGTDLKKIQYGLTPPPRIFGHETAGVVTAVGEGVEKWKVGDRLMVNHHVPCLRDDCFYCQRRDFSQCPVYKKTGTTAGFEPAGGGFAEYVRVMDWCADKGAVRIPDDISFEEAVFVEPLNTCLKGLERAGLKAGDTVIIIGQGPIGLLFTLLAKAAGANVIGVDTNPARREISKQLGADLALEPGDHVKDEAKQLSNGRGADLCIVAVATTVVMDAAFDWIRPAGSVLLFAQTRLDDLVSIDAGSVCMLEKTLVGSYSSDILLQDKAADLIFSRKIDVRPLITHRFPLNQIANALDLAMHPSESSLKVIVNP